MTLTHTDIASLFLALALLLGTARALGEIAVRLRQPAIVGELLAGILLGPTVLGTFAPALQKALFSPSPAFGVALSGLTSLAIVLFLLVAGMEVDLSTLWRQGRAAVSVSIMGILMPFALGFGTAWYFPTMFPLSDSSEPFTFSLFFATALSISALPVIAKILMDLHLFRSDLGVTVIAATIFNDVFGWIVFALILTLLGTHETGLDLRLTIVLFIGFIALMMTFGRWGLHRSLPWVQAHTSWPGGVLGFALAGALLCAAFTEWIGVHAIFGAFMFGIALGDSHHLRERTRATLHQFISFIFAPLFFASIGLKVNFATNFHLEVTLLVLILATVGKVVGCGLAAYWANMGARQSWALGFAMNARGAMEIILGLLALQAGLIGEPLFVALVIMALVTSMMGAFFIPIILKLEKPRRFTDYLSGKSFVSDLGNSNSREAIDELVETVCAQHDLEQGPTAHAVWQREEMMSTSLGHGIAVPHARLAELKSPVVAIGLARDGVDFDSADGEPTRLVCLILTAEDDHRSQIDILADISRTFLQPGMLDRALAAKSYTEFLSLVRTEN